MSPSVDGIIELVAATKLLGVWIQDNFRIDRHVDYILSLCSQRIYVMKRLRDQGLNCSKVVTKCFPGYYSYAYIVCYPGMGMFSIERVGTLYDDACMKLFHKIRSGHCMTFCLLKMASTMTCAGVPILLCYLSVIVIF